MTDLFRKKDAILFLLLVATLHILLTYLVSSRAGNVTGAQIAGVVSGSLLNREAADEVLQDIAAKPDRESNVYLHILSFLSLPFGPIVQPVHEQWVVRPALENKINEDEYAFRVNLIGTATRVLNSIVFSLLVYWCFRVMQRRRKIRMHNNT